MKKVKGLSFLFFLLMSCALFAGDIRGFWKTIDDKTGQAQSVIGIYEYQGKYYGRIIGSYAEDGQMYDTLYTPKERAPGVPGNPYYAGMDIIWNLRWKGPKYKDGKILDPEHGKVYDLEMWTTPNGNLIVRGKIWIFGRNQTWLPASDTDFPRGFRKPDLQQFVPLIPRVE